MTEEMTCQQLVELVTEHLEHRLSAGEEARFRAHLQECDGCADYVEQLRAVVAIAGSVNEASIPPEVEERLLVAFRGWHRDRS